jgi:hypothetical protein
VVACGTISGLSHPTIVIMYNVVNMRLFYRHAPARLVSPWTDATV